MSKNSITFFFLFIFSLFISTPTIILMVEDNIDVSTFYGVNEEENKNETSKKIEVNLFNSSKYNIAQPWDEKEKLNFAYLKLSPQHIMESFSPPPEQNIHS
ncbi:MAG TPA: hypothetical protein VFF15_02965 [Flavobacteriaceae bacterium]|nr:hypothetical protein [Flavobacteriaceae bacterium]